MTRLHRSPAIVLFIASAACANSRIVEIEDPDAVQRAVAPRWGPAVIEYESSYAGHAGGGRSVVRIYECGSVCYRHATTFWQMLRQRFDLHETAPTRRFDEALFPGFLRFEARVVRLNALEGALLKKQEPPGDAALCAVLDVFTDPREGNPSMKRSRSVAPVPVRSLNDSSPTAIRSARSSSVTTAGAGARSSTTTIADRAASTSRSRRIVRGRSRGSTTAAWCFTSKT